LLVLFTKLPNIGNNAKVLKLNFFHFVEFVDWNVGMA